jgi:hypothetical protein
VGTSVENTRSGTVVRIRMPSTLKRAFFEFAASKGSDASELLREFAGACVSGSGGVRQGRVRDLSLVRIERKLDYLLSLARATEVTPLQRDVAKALTGELHRDLSAWLQKRRRPGRKKGVRREN